MAKDLGHKYARQDLRALLEERDKENTFLRRQLAARAEHTAHLEARLLATLDTLDDLQTSTTREVEGAHRENARLLEKFNAWQAVAREADREKADMSNAVMQLVGKVESCNDYSKWRASRIEFSHDITLHPIRPSRTSQPDFSYKDPGECKCANAYSPAVVEELSDSLAREQRAHALTREEAERRIAVLHSRIAVRDTEITRRAATCRCLPPSLDTSVHLELMSEEEQARMSRRTAERIRDLDSEVTVLGEKLVLERRTHRSTSRHRVDQSIQTEASSSSPPIRRRLSQDPTRNPAAQDEYDETPAALSVIDSQIAQLRKRLTDLVAEKEALRFVLHNELEVQDPVVLLSPRKRRRRLEQLDLAEGSNKHDNRPDEEHRDESRSRSDEFKDVLLLEEECIRLMHSEDHLRDSLDCLQLRCTSLSEENTRLRAEISELRRSKTSANDRPSPLSLPPLDTLAIDRAFPPLQPDAISPINGDKRDTAGRCPNPCPSHERDQIDLSSSSSASSSGSPITPTSVIEPSDVPLPRTPSFDDTEQELLESDNDNHDSAHDEAGESEPHASSSRPSSPIGREEQVPLPPPDVPPHAEDVRDAQTIERELAEARVDAEIRDREIAEVRDLMADLALRIGDELHRPEL